MSVKSIYGSPSRVYLDWLEEGYMELSGTNYQQYLLKIHMATPDSLFTCHRPETDFI